MEKVIKKAPVIGFVRYSLKGKFGNRKKERDVFEAEYFEYRFEIFKKITLKSFQNQTNNNFVLLLLHSENMPSAYKQRFIELEKANLFLYNVFVKDTHEALNEAIKHSVEYAFFEKDTVITFRIDNDDAVQNDFIHKLSGFLKEDFVGFSISMPSICIVKRISDTSYMIEERNCPSNSIGLAYASKKEQYKTVIELGNHARINNTTPMVVTAQCSTMQLQTINGENEANAINETNAKILDKEKLYEYLTERKMTNLDLDCLRVYDIV